MLPSPTAKVFKYGRGLKLQIVGLEFVGSLFILRLYLLFLDMNGNLMLILRSLGRDHHYFDKPTQSEKQIKNSTSNVF